MIVLSKPLPSLNVAKKMKKVLGEFENPGGEKLFQVGKITRLTETGLNNAWKRAGKGGIPTHDIHWFEVEAHDSVVHSLNTNDFLKSIGSVLCAHDDKISVSSKVSSNKKPGQYLHLVEIHYDRGVPR